MSRRPVTVRPLLPSDAGAFFALRREALLDAPLAFAASPEDDRAASVEAVAELLAPTPEAVVLGAHSEALVGSVGVYRDRHRKRSHKVHLWGMVVAPAHRGAGVATALLGAALGWARGLSGVAWVELGVSSAAPEALRLYTRHGFVEWGGEPEGLVEGARAVTLHHLALRLDGV